jgi:hypothetical protein
VSDDGPTRLARLVLVGSALAFAVIAVPFLVAPSAMAPHVGLSLAGALADNDVRAVYGGLQLGCAAFLGFCALAPHSIRTGLIAQLLLFGGLVLGRFASWLVVGLPGPLGLALHGAEVLALALGGVALLRLSPFPRSQQRDG